LKYQQIQLLQVKIFRLVMIKDNDQLVETDNNLKKSKAIINIDIINFLGQLIIQLEVCIVIYE